MRRLLFLIAFVLLFVGSVTAQVSSVNAKRIYSGTAVPNWACSPGPSYTDFYLRTTTDVLYYCSAAPDTWSVFANAGGGAAWGTITGTLSSQTDLQTALNLKAPLASPTFTGTVTIPTPFTLGAVSVLPTGTELNFVDGVTSAIQTQIDAKPNVNSTDGVIPYRSSATAFADSPLVRSTANLIQQRNSTTAQVLEVYNTYTNSSNGEWGGFRWVADTLQIGTRQNGSGVARTVYLKTEGAGRINFTTNNTDRWYIHESDGNLLAISDNTTDIGASGATRPRSGYFGTALTSSLYKTTTNCADSAGAAACGAAAAGAVVVDAAATTVVVSTTAVTATSRILITFDSSLGTELGITCNTTPVLPTVSARTAATSFTITVAVAPITLAACFSYSLIN